MHKYVPAPAFGRTGMSRKRFDFLFCCLRCGEQPAIRLPDMSSEMFRWKLVDGFINNYNAYRASNFVPSEQICVDESMPRWFRLGGNWINIGLPQYVAIDRKPEDGCEVQNAACRQSGVMLWLKVVKGAIEEELALFTAQNEDGMLHGANVCKYLVQLWAFSDRVVCGDSYFASVPTVKELRCIGLRFIGVVKTATKIYPIAWLSNVEL